MDTWRLRKQLMERRGELLEEMRSRVRLEDRGPEAIPADVADFAADVLDQELGVRIAEMRSREILQIDEALEKLGDGGWGLCKQCGTQIPQARLQVVPSATLCVNCQEESDRVIMQSQNMSINGYFDDAFPDLDADSDTSEAESAVEEEEEYAYDEL